MKKIISVVCLISLIFSFSTIAYANNDISVTIDGTPLEFDVAPQIINDRTMVPMRAIFEHFGLDVQWNPDTQSISASNNIVNIKMQINNYEMYVNGEKITLDACPVIINSRTLVPVRAISEALNSYVGWENDSRTVRILSSKSPVPSQVQGTWRYSYLEFNGEIISKENATGMDIFKKDFTVTVDGLHATLKTDDESYVVTTSLDCSGNTYTIMGLTVSIDGNLMRLSGMKQGENIVLEKIDAQAEKPDNADIVGTWAWSNIEVPIEQLAANKVTTYVGDDFQVCNITFNADGSYITYDMGYLWYVSAETGEAFYDGARGAGMNRGTYKIDGNTIALHNKIEAYPQHNEDCSWVWKAELAIDIQEDSFVITNTSCDSEYDEYTFGTGKKYKRIK